MNNNRKIEWKALLIVGVVLLAIQALPIVGNAKIGGNPWNAPTFLKGSAGQIAYDAFGLIGYLIIGIVGFVLTIVAILRSRRQKDVVNNERGESKTGLMTQEALAPVDRGRCGSVSIPICASVFIILLCAYLGYSNAALKNELSHLSALVNEKDAQLAKVEDKITDAVAAHDEDWNLYLSTVEEMSKQEPVDEAVQINALRIGELNAEIDNVRGGKYNGVPTENDCKEVYHTIGEMFRGADEFQIYSYISKIYHFETEQYPIEYFKDKGYVYTGDEIDGWEP